MKFCKCCGTVSPASLLTRRQHEIVEYLWGRKGEWVLRKELIAHLWSAFNEPDSASNVVSIELAKLRKLMPDVIESRKGSIGGWRIAC